ncbi:heparan-alpha-glucosaminide N-acetyltransferase-like isoform X3 [Clytia hemisphaerica]|uniref:heparan-alpha-glucosaminide N-acetyltransferase-like isoform X3 n=1 Tax=Clytia hemisphaerica TaxID=252671 RepID=UPI0034D5CD93
MVSFVLLNLAIQKYNSTRMISYESIEDSQESERKSFESSSKYGSIPPHEHKLSVASLSHSLNSNQKVPARLGSLDTFRGISILVMIFVNYGGGKYWFFNHSKWNGLTVADLVFPWFIFIMGASIFISCRSIRRKTIPKITITKKIIVRSIKLFALGLFINNGIKLRSMKWKDYEHWRIPGVLQRFALSYLVVAILNVWCSPEEETVNTLTIGETASVVSIATFHNAHFVSGLPVFDFLVTRPRLQNWIPGTRWFIRQWNAQRLHGRSSCLHRSKNIWLESYV